MPLPPTNRHPIDAESAEPVQAVSTDGASAESALTTGKLVSGVPETVSEPAIAIQGLGKMYRLYSNPSDKVLDVFGLNKLLFWRKYYFQEFWALRDFNLTVRRGERLGLIGRNGAGKSTLLKIIASTVVPTEGNVNVGGKIQALMELGTAFHPEFTGRENIRASLAYQGLSGADIDDREEDIIDFAELNDFIDQPIKTYSAGMQARLAFSTATAIQPDILIVDEVLGAGDAYFSGKCVERMQKLTENNDTTVLFVSHDLGSVQALCDRAIWIDRGKVVSDGKPLDVIRQYSTMVREEDEIRLRAKDLKISKQQAAALDAHQDIYQNVLFRIITDSEQQPKQQHKIRQLSLTCADETIGHIQLGSPMDNANHQQHHILDQPKLMNWGKPGQDETGYYRPYGNFRGRYIHAPYEFAMPKSFLAAAEVLTLSVDADINDESIAVDLFSPASNSYQRLGLLPNGQATATFQINPKLLSAGEAVDHADGLKLTAIDEYGSKEALLENVRITNHKGEESKTLYSLEPFEISLNYRTKVPLDAATFVFCVYLPSGQCATQWIVKGSDINGEPLDEQGQVVFKSAQCLLGKGSYVASAAIFKYFNSDGHEPESYHLLDRCIHFQVCDRDPTDLVNYGICRQPIEVAVRSANGQENRH
ncbi:MAG: ABC transporter ATP-binding protein [Cyanobacteria bacterium J06598_3]